MLDVHHPLCFAYNRALRHSQVRMFCMYRGNALERDSPQSANRGTCFDDSDMLDKPELDAQLMIRTNQMLVFSDRRSAFCIAFPLNGSRFGVPRACRTRFRDRSLEMRRKTLTVVQKRISWTHKNPSQIVHVSQTPRVRTLERRS